MAYLTPETIDPQAFLAAPTDYHRGASVLFLGIVRDHSQAKQVLFLEYEAYESMAEALLDQLVLAAKAQWPLAHVRLRHRIGRVHLGEIAVAIEVSSAHRDEAYRASRFLIDEIKHRVPIWKKEHFSDGSSEWSLCRHPAAHPHHEHPHPVAVTPGVAPSGM
ncbi:MAG TPA: molybdenum cofactor biosynthesis protein MoaE [Polyangiaceae bacterium]|nr:molybdenum cofactor biosynthesis protein MoaE [Polyangiaceae bacterium]